MTEFALSFNGQDQFVSLGTLESFGLQRKDFTVEAWIKLASLRPDGPDQTILSGGAQTPSNGLHLVSRKTRLRLGFYNNDTPGNTPLIENAWFHVAYRYTMQNGEQAIFVNGLLDVATTGHAPFTGTGVATLGQAFISGYFHGTMADVRIWSSARAEQQIQASMYTRLRGNEAGLVAYWPLNDGSTTVARDAIAPVDKTTGQPLPESQIQRHPGQIRGATWTAIDTPIRQGSMTPAMAAQFDGVNSSITVPNSPALVLENAITVEAWVRATGMGKDLFNYPVISKHGSLMGWELRAGSAQCGFMVTVNKTHQQALAGGLDSNRYYHIAGVYDGQLIRLYVNGVLRTSLAVSGPINQYPDVLTLGKNSYWPERLFAGQIAEVRVFSRARTQAEIQANIYTRLVGNEPGLVALWRLSGDAKDASPNAQHGKIVTAVSWVSSGVPLPPGVTTATIENDPEKLRALLALRDQDVQNLTIALQQSSAQVEAVQRDLASLGRLNDQLNQQLATLQVQVDRLTPLTTTVAQKQAQIDALNAQIAELAKAGGAQTRLEEFVKNANDEITKARTQLQQQGSDYSLGRVTMEVKMLPGPGGVGMRFPQMDEIKTLDSKHLSTLNVEFDAREVKETVTAPLVTVPSVIDYTEIVARRKLNAANFLVDVSYQAVTVVAGEPIQVDRVVAQLPLPGTAAASGSTITIFLGRES